MGRSVPRPVRAYSLTKAERAEIARLAHAGASPARIAHRLARPSAEIIGFLAAAGLRALTPEQLARARRGRPAPPPPHPSLED